jgi:hypothetical protein
MLAVAIAAFNEVVESELGQTVAKAPALVEAQATD